MNSRPLFSIIHPSARPGQWRKVYDDWLANCIDPSQVEYILGADERWGFNPFDCAPNGERGFASFRLSWNHGRRCMVDAVNYAASLATGAIIIVIADDQYSCEGWDNRLAEVIPDVRPEFVVEVSTGTPGEHDRGIFIMPILSRSRYERLGYVFYYGYESMYADNDLCAHSRADRIVLDARQLMFPHRHPVNDPSIPTDDVYIAQNRPEAYRLGSHIFDERRRNGFNNSIGSFGVPQKQAAPPKVVHLMLPGEQFSAAWVRNLTLLICELNTKGFAAVPHFFHCSNVFITRNILAEAVLKVQPCDYIIWLDDDQLVSAGQALKLLAELDRLGPIDVVAGWSWIQADVSESEAKCSCGDFLADGRLRFISSFRYDDDPELFEVQWTGFPFVAMRRDALAAAGEQPFRPLPTTCTKNGYYGDDIAFSIRLREAGGRIYVDPSVYVPHLKLREAVPMAAPAKHLEAAMT